MIKKIITLVCCLVVTFGCLFVANNIQKDNGNVDVSMDCFEMEYIDLNGEKQTGTVVYKMYVPKGVDASKKAPALLMLHGYQNDHETDAGFRIRGSGGSSAGR